MPRCRPVLCLLAGACLSPHPSPAGSGFAAVESLSPSPGLVREDSRQSDPSCDTVSAVLGRDRGSLAALARGSGLPLWAVFRAFRGAARGTRPRPVEAGAPPELWLAVPGPERLATPGFFTRMPLDQWRTPEDGTWGVSRSGGRRRHKGIDMHAPEGTPIFTVADGTVVRAWTEKPLDQDGGYGNYVILEHRARDGAGYRYWTYYTHMKDPPTVSEGDLVPAGTRIGEVGRSPVGRFENPHLHFEVRLADGSELGVAVNPTPFGAFRPRFTTGEGAY